MRTKTISRWRKAALAGTAAASLALPARAQDAAQSAPATHLPPADPTPAPAPTDATRAPADPSSAPANADANGAPAQAPENARIPAQNAPPPAPEPGQSQEYTIQKGDTLWDLSQKFLANPWYWPKIWSLNPQIENPHWIYPGNKLTIKGGAAGGPAQVEAPGEQQPGTENASAQANGEENGAQGDSSQLGVSGSAQESAEAAQVVTSSGRLSFQPPAVVTVLAPGLVSQEEIDNAGVIDSSFEEKGMISVYDTAYVRFKQPDQVRVGDRLTLFRPAGEITNPKTGEKVAIRTETVGEAKVVAINNGIHTVQITGERFEVERGYLARPWADESRRLAPKANGRALDGMILGHAGDTLSSFATGQQVFIDKGSKDGVELGNTFTVVVHGDGLGSTSQHLESFTQSEAVAQASRHDPDEAIGLVMVIDARDNISTAIIVHSIRELEPGDRVEMRARGGG